MDLRKQEPPRVGRRRIGVLTLFVAAAVTVAAFGPSAAGSGARSDQTIPLLRVGITPPQPLLDGARVSTATYLTSMLLEQLLQIGPDGNVKPWLADRVTQPGRAIYVYHLRPGVKFWDGKRLTAQDVANAVNYYRDPGSTNAFLFSSVKSVVALDRSRVAFTLKHPDATFKWVPAQYSSQVFEKAFGDAHKGALGRPGVGTMGTGPWKIVSFDPTQGLELTANDNYWGGKPQIRRISVKFFADENSMAIAFRAGEIDVAPLVLGAQAFASTANTKLISKPSCQTAIFTMNTQTAPFNDIHVRRAVAYAINRADLIKANGGYASPNYAIVPRVHLLGLGPAAQVDKLLNSLPQYRHDLAKAKQELAQSKYPNGFSFDMVEFAFGTFNNVSQAISGQLAKIGLKANVKIVSPGEWYATVTGPNDKRPEIFSTVGCNSPDPSFITTLILGKAGLRPGSFNIANYAPADVEQLIQSGLQVTNRAKRLAIYGKILQRVGQDVPYVPLWVQNGNAALSSKFTWKNYDAAFFNRVWPLEIHPK